MLLSLPTAKHGPGPGAPHGDIVTAPNVSDVALPNPFPKRLTLVPPFASPWFGSIAWMTGTVAVSKVNFVAALVALVLAPTSTVTSTVALAGPGGAGLTKRSVSPPGKKQPPGPAPAPNRGPNPSGPPPHPSGGDTQIPSPSGGGQGGGRHQRPRARGDRRGPKVHARRPADPAAENPNVRPAIGGPMARPN